MLHNTVAEVENDADDVTCFPFAASDEKQSAEGAANRPKVSLFHP